MPRLISHVEGLWCLLACFFETVFAVFACMYVCVCMCECVCIAFCFKNILQNIWGFIFSRIDTECGEGCDHTGTEGYSYPLWPSNKTVSFCKLIIMPSYTYIYIGHIGVSLVSIYEYYYWWLLVFRLAIYIKRFIYSYSGAEMICKTHSGIDNDDERGSGLRWRNFRDGHQGCSYSR